MAESVAPYRALALQMKCEAVNGLSVDESRSAMSAAIDHLDYLIDGAQRFIGLDSRLIVVPEYFMTGFPFGESIPEWRAKAAIDVDGPEYERLAGIASQRGIFLAGNAYETDEHFPELYFQCSFIIDPAGDVVVRYRRLVSLFAPTPHDVWSRYLDVYGADAVFPVATTELGRLAAVASEEILYPEITRAFALKGAEVIAHSTSEIGSPSLTPKDVAKRARAFENCAYVVSANSAGVFGTAIAERSTDGMSKIVDFNGDVVVEAGYGESLVAAAEIDLEALRRARRRPGMSNTLSRQRTELFTDVYGGTQVYPVNTLLDADGSIKRPDRTHFIQTQRATIAKLVDDELI